MSARTDLDNAFSILDAAIEAHVASLAATKAVAVTALATANDESYIQDLTVKVIKMADALHASNPPSAPPASIEAPAAPEPVAPVVTVAELIAPPPPLPAFLVPAVAPATLVDAPQAPVVTASVATPEPPAATASVPSVLETMEAVIRAAANAVTK